MTEKGIGMDDNAYQAVADLGAAALSDAAVGTLLARLHAGVAPLVLAGPGGLLQLGVCAAMVAYGHPPRLLVPDDLAALPIPSVVVLVSDGANGASISELDALADFLDRGGEIVLLSPAVTSWATLASREGGQFVFVPFGEGIDVLAEARREIARLQLRLTLYAQEASHPTASGINHLITLSTGSEGRNSRSLTRSLKMVGYALFPFGRRRRLKRRQMMTAIWGY